MKKLLVVAMAMFSLCTTAHASLVGRDINGGAVAGNAASAVFLYDDVLNLTWLRNAGNGAMTWSQAVSWASSLNGSATVGGTTGWRLPTLIANPNATFSYAGGTDYGYNVRTKSGNLTQYQAGQTVYSEMASLWYDTLGNLAFCPRFDATCSGGIPTPQPGSGLTRTGNFKNLLPTDYWSGLTYAPDTLNAWSFNTNGGSQQFSLKAGLGYALAVRTGDVLVASPVPLPAATWLLMSGLGGLGAAARRRKAA
jgi:hypothetical protein